MADIIPGFSLPITCPDGWGPGAKEEKVLSISYQHFVKTERLGKIADFVSTRYPGRSGQQSGGNISASAFSGGVMEEDIATDFQINQSRLPRFRPRARAGRAMPTRQGQTLTNRSGFSSTQNRSNLGRTAGGRGGQRGRYAPKISREMSVQTADKKKIHHWAVGELTREGSGSDVIPIGKDILTAGHILTFEPKIEEVRPDKPLTLDGDEVRHRTVYVVHDSSADPIIEEIAGAISAGDESIPNMKELLGHPVYVFATDSALAYLMASPKSVFPWDVTFQVVTEDDDDLPPGKKPTKYIFLSRRTAAVEKEYTVNENNSTMPQDQCDDAAQEAFFINNIFRLQLRKAQGKDIRFDRANPFHQVATKAAAQPLEPPLPIGYRYRWWDLGSGMILIGRCEVHGAKRIDKKDQMGSKEKSLFQAFAMTEANPTDTKWRQQLEKKSGEALVTELKNNGPKMLRWAACAMLSGVDEVLLGFVTRKFGKASQRSYDLLMLDQKARTPGVLLQDIGCQKPASLWQALRTILNYVVMQEDGKYVLAKDNNNINLYSCEDSG